MTKKADSNGIEEEVEQAILGFLAEEAKNARFETPYSGIKDAVVKAGVEVPERLVTEALIRLEGKNDVGIRKIGKQRRYYLQEVHNIVAEHLST